MDPSRPRSQQQAQHLLPRNLPSRGVFALLTTSLPHRFRFSAGEHAHLYLRAPYSAILSLSQGSKTSIGYSTFRMINLSPYR